MKKFDLSAIMRKAWKLYRKGVAAFSECLHRAWNSAKAEPINAQRIEEAQQAAGVAGKSPGTWWNMAQRPCFRRYSSTAAKVTARPTAHRSLALLR